MASEEQLQEIGQDNSPRLHNDDNTSEKTGEDSQNDTDNNIDSKYEDEKRNNTSNKEEDHMESKSESVENSRVKETDSEEDKRMDESGDHKDNEENDHERQNNEEADREMESEDFQEQHKNEDENNEDQENRSEQEENEEVQGTKGDEEEIDAKEEEDQKVFISVQELDEEKEKMVTIMKDTFDNEFMSQSQSERFNASRKKLTENQQNISAQIRQRDQSPNQELSPEEENYHLKQQLMQQTTVVNELKEILQEERAVNHARNQEIYELKMIVLQLQRNLQNLTQQSPQGSVTISSNGINDTIRREAEGLQGLNTRLQNPTKNYLNEAEAKYWSECAEFLSDTTSSKPLWVEAKETMAENELYGIKPAKDQNTKQNQQKSTKMHQDNQKDNKSDSTSIASISKSEKTPYTLELEKLALANQKEFAKVYALGKLRMQQIAAQDYQILRQQAQDKRNQMNEMKTSIDSSNNNGLIAGLQVSQNNNNNNRYNKNQISPIVKVEQNKNQQNNIISNVLSSNNFENITPPLPVDYYKQFWIEKQTNKQGIQPQQQQQTQSYTHKLSNKEIAQQQQLSLQSQLQSIQVNLPPIEQNNKQIKVNGKVFKQSPGITNQQENKQQGLIGSIIQSLEIGSIPSLTKPTNGAGSAPIIKQSNKITTNKDNNKIVLKQQKLSQDDNSKFQKEQDNIIFMSNQQGIRDKNKVSQADNLLKADIQATIITERMNRNIPKQQQNSNKGLILRDTKVEKSNSQRKTPVELKRPYLDRKKHSEHSDHDKIAYEPSEQIFSYKQQLQRKL